MSDGTDGGSDNPARRRRRIRHSAVARQGGGPTPRRSPADVPDRAAPSELLDSTTLGTAPVDRDTERGLRGLVGAGTSQLSVSAALRARDASRPTEADLAEAEEQLVLVRRNWVPREI